MAKGVATAPFFLFYKKLKKKIRDNTESFEYNWSNCKNLKLWRVDCKIKTLVFELKNIVNFGRINCNFP
jgi:hypothetical protein